MLKKQDFNISGGINWVVVDETNTNSRARIQSVSDIIDSRPMSHFQVRIISLCGLVLFSDGFDSQTIGFLAPFIIDSTKTPEDTFGPIFSASLIGLMVAVMLAGPIADRWGRKWPIIFSTVTLAVFSMLTAHAASFNRLLIYRFLTGLGFGGALPNVVALSSEYVPKRLMAVLVAVLFCGLPLGGFICGMLSAAMAPVWGWQSVFYIGGIFPLALSILLIVFLPESVQFLSQQKADPQKITKLLAPIAPEIAGEQVQLHLPQRGNEGKGISVKHLFMDGRTLGTILLWIPNFMNLLLMYVIVYWLPILLPAAGMSVSDGVTATSFYSLGGILGTFAEGFLMKFGGSFRVLLVQFGLCALFIAAMAMMADLWLLVAMLAFLLGFLVIGAQAGLNVLAAQFYPTFIRSTGVGWALGMGRIGSIVGPLLAGVLISQGWQPGQVLLAGAVPALLAFASILVGRWLPSGQTPYHAINDSSKSAGHEQMIRESNS